MYAVLVEGGKTKTLSIVVNEHGHMLGHSLSGSSGWTTVGFDRALENLVESIVGAVRKSSLEINEIDIAILGLSDIDTEEAKEYFVKRLKSLGLFKADAIIVPDFVTAYYAVTLGDPGIAVIAGTGSIAYGRNSRNVSARAGGWGWFGGDEGSAIWIAMKAIEAAGKYFNGRGPKTLMGEKLLNFFKIKDPLQLINVVYSKVRENVGELGQLAKVVDEAAEEGDQLAQEILIKGGRELALMAKAVYDKIYVDEDKFIVGGVGSVYSSRTLKDSFINSLKEYLPSVNVVEPITQYMPIKGLAALLAEKANLSRKIAESVAECVRKIK
ncbi:MAG: BadF/BadG/BcrA/BcrD ATPase family protein [Desulfurococcaceae archaeon]